MDKTYQPHEIEQSWYQTWEKKGYFAPSGKGDPYCIMIPPPNVTGSLHMGHAFQHTLMDTLIRYRRMQGRNTLWQVGTDHAGIATQMVVERKLAAEQGLTRHDLGRDGFIEKIWEWKEASGGTITRQMRRLGDSVDWRRERLTMDSGFYRAVQEVFIRLYDDQLIYRASAWSTGIQNCTPPSPIWRWRTAPSRARCGTCATRWPMGSRRQRERITSWSAPPARKPCSATPGGGEPGR